jgi:hypothetical protein
VARVVLRVFVVFLLVFVFDPFCFHVLVGRGFGQSAAEARTVRGQANSLRPPRRQSVFQGSLLEVLLAFSDSLWLRPDSPPYACGQSTGLGRTVRVARADSPPLLAGPVRQWLAALLLGLIPPSLLSCFCVCFKESFLRLEVDP